MTQSPHRHRTQGALGGNPLRKLVRWLYACAWVVVGLESAAYGEAAGRVVLVHSEESPSPLVQRLRVDVTNLGVEVVEASDIETTDPIKFLSEVAAHAGAFAALRVVSTSAGTNVWVADRATSTTLVRTIASTDPPIKAQIIAIQAIEFVRASLMDLERPRDEPTLARGKTTPDEVPSIEHPNASARRLRVALGPALLLASQEIGPSVYAQIAVGYRWTGRIASRGFLLVPTVASTLRQNEGSAEIRATVAGLAGDVDLLSPEDAWRPRLSAELAVVQLRTDGRGAAGYLGQKDTVYVAMPIARAALVGRLTPWMALTADLLGGLCLGRPYVTFGERRVATWGPLVAGAGIGVQFEID